ncbi:ATP-binding protein [Gimibacter soli]|uniref:histidine kinase n=2 Tax=Gimibacter soli TaxID=3024400 RepID=A0AAF0BLC6_9PROT|nr:ATP-binding protein [Gimibacter soli]WCL53011.1 ATP-binding protein [Gimibacter soli]
MEPADNSYKSLLSERSVIAVLSLLLILMWTLGLTTPATVITVGGAAFVLLVQLEGKRRLDILRARHTAHPEPEEVQTEGTMSMRAHALNGLPSPVLIVDDQHKIVFANDSATAFLGANLVDEDVFLFLRHPRIVQSVDAALTDGPQTAGSLRYTAAHDRSFDITIAPLAERSSRGGRQAMIYFYEVTSLLRTEQMRADFVANASHELRTPLSSVIGAIETIQGPARDDPDATQRFLSIMQKEAERMARLIDDLLSLSRIEMSRHVAPDTQFEIGLVIGNVINALVGQAGERDIVISNEVAAGLPSVRGDDDQITQVLLNLLMNAIKYANRGTTVHVKAELLSNGAKIRIAVADEGPGIAPEHLTRLTERFYRIDTARSRKMGGTGLGLAIVKHILLRHETNLDIRSEVGKGSSFAFALPVSKSDAK